MDKRLRFMTDLIGPLRVAPGTEVRLSREHDPGYTGQVTRPQAASLLAEGVELLADYQDRLAAQDTFGVLLVLQGIDAAGKDSTIKHVMSEEMLSRTSTKRAPWYVVPADHKWFTRLATAAVLVTALDAINPRYPAADPAVRDQMAQVRAELAAELGLARAEGVTGRQS
jgi:polyphosphate kinase 2 (PPK2 family)